MAPGSAPRPGRSPRPGRRISILLLFLAALPAGAFAQSPGPRGPAARDAPLREDPANWWGEVHGWTGSDATRPRAARTPAAPPVPGRAAAPARDGRTNVLTSATARANVRREPSLSAPVLRSMERGSRLTVFGEAPGGWLQVGEDEPFGWMHESALQR